MRAAAVRRAGLAADAFSTDWATAAKSEARLVAAGGALAGFEIRLAPGAITYWRDPGDAGVPPTFDFSGSDNVAKRRAGVPGAEADPRGRRRARRSATTASVVIPLKVEPRDPAKPVTLALHADYAVCEKLCLPAEAKLTLTLPGAVSPYAPQSRRRCAAAPRPRRARGVRRARPATAPRAGGCARPTRRARRATCSSSRRKAGGWPRRRRRAKGPRLFHHHAPRQAEGGRPPRALAADHDRRRGAGRNDRGRPVAGPVEVSPRARKGPVQCATSVVVLGGAVGGPRAAPPAPTGGLAAGLCRFAFPE